MDILLEVTIVSMDNSNLIASLVELYQVDTRTIVSMDNSRSILPITVEVIAEVFILLVFRVLTHETNLT